MKLPYYLLIMHFHWSFLLKPASSCILESNKILIIYITVVFSTFIVTLSNRLTVRQRHLKWSSNISSPRNRPRKQLRAIQCHHGRDGLFLRHLSATCHIQDRTLTHCQTSAYIERKTNADKTFLYQTCHRYATIMHAMRPLQRSI